MMNKNILIQDESFKVSLKGKKYNLPEINEFIKYIVKLPINETDKHIIPQSKFIEDYLNHKKLKIFNVSCITKILSEIGVKNSSFPNNKISLKQMQTYLT